MKSEIKIQNKNGTPLKRKQGKNVFRIAVLRINLRIYSNSG